MLLAHETPDLRSGVVQHLDESDRGLIEKIADAERQARSIDEWAMLVFGSDADAVPALHGLVERFNAAAERIGASLRVHIDDGPASLDPARGLWFACSPLPTGEPVQAKQQSSEDDFWLDPDFTFALGLVDEPLPTKPQAPEESGALRRAPSSSAKLRKRLANVFVSYAREDQIWVRPLLDRLKFLCKSDSRFEIRFWRDEDELGFGPFWQQIDEAIKLCDVGLLLLSDRFLESTFIRDHELPHFNYHGRGNRKPCAVVDCVKTDREHIKRREIDASQIIAPDTDGVIVELSSLGAEQQARFLERVAEKLFLLLGSLPLQELESAEFRLQEIEAVLSVLPVDDTPHLQRNQASKARWSEFKHSEANPSDAPGFDARLDAVDSMLKWARDESALPFCALLGQYGQGKSTSLRRLARELFRQRASGAKAPIPIYIDLRLGSPIRDGAPTLAELLADHIRRHEALAGSGVTVEELVDLVRRHDAVMIFDGFDEVAVHLDTGEAQRFANELWKVLPDPSARTDEEFRGKLLISCRSHFFRDLQEQARVFLFMARRAIREDQQAPGSVKRSKALVNVLDGDFLLLILLPFDKAQVVSYFTSALGSAKLAQRAMETIEDIHNLTELSERPVLLPMLAHCLPAIELAAARQEVVNATTVYDYMVGAWLGRDVDKNKLMSRHKQLLMEELAAKLHRESRQELSATQLDEWLDRFISERSELAQAYRSEPGDPRRPNLDEILQSHLRTATFVIRTEHAADDGLFRFAHTSLAEYFFARHLVRSLEERRPQAWQIRLPSVETLEFVVQLLARKRRPDLDAALKTWASLLEGGGEGSVLAFRCWLLARREKIAEPDPAWILLDGADLAGVHLVGRPGAPWILRRASFRRALLVRTHWHHVWIEDADFGEAQLSDAIFDDCVLDGANFGQAVLSGTQVRFGSTRGCDARWFAGEERSRFLLQSQEAWEHAVLTSGATSGATVRLVRSMAVDSTALCCAASADASLFATGYEGGRVLLWDANTGRAFREFYDWNETGPLVFSQDGRRLLVPSTGRSIGVWNTGSGLRGKFARNFFGNIRHADFSPDGRRFITGSDDGGVQLWSVDEQHGPVAIVHSGTTGESIEGCIFSPDGRLVAVAVNNYVFCYDVSAAASRLLCRLPGEGRFGIAFSSDGRTLASVGADRVVRFHDLATLLERRIVRVNREAESILLSPDARYLAVQTGDSVVAIEVDTGKQVLVLWHSVNLSSTRFLGSDRLMACLQDGSLELRDLTSGRCVRKLPIRNTHVMATCVSLNGDRIFMAYDGHKLRRWKTQGEPATEPIPDWNAGLRVLDVSPDQSRLAAFDPAMRALVVIDTADGNRLHSERMDEMPAVRFSADGQSVLVVPQREARTWWGDVLVRGVATNKLLRRLPAPGWRFSLDARLPASLDAVGIGSSLHSEGCRLLHWRSLHGTEFYEFDDQPGILSYAVSDDGCSVAVGFNSGEVEICILKTRSRTQTLASRGLAVTRCAFAADGRTIIAGYADGGIYVWDCVSGELVSTLWGHSGRVTDLCLDGTRLATAANDGTVRLWDLEEKRCLRVWHLLPDDEYAVFDPERMAPIAASPRAWRYFDTRVKYANGRMQMLPAEAVTGRWPGC
jgi:WD40 repeat protein/DNA polymerase III delta prime subunit